jgi:hypothetical protein
MTILLTDDQAAKVRTALTNDGTHEDDCPYSNDCFNTDCDYCSPIREQREKEALAILDGAQCVEVVDTKDRAFVAIYEDTTPLYAVKETK